jgi:hypothetical protein
MMMGWCMDDHHEQCRREYTDWNDKTRTCSCTCHEEGSHV